MNVCLLPSLEIKTMATLLSISPQMDGCTVRTRPKAGEEEEEEEVVDLHPTYRHVRLVAHIIRLQSVRQMLK